MYSSVDEISITFEVVMPEFTGSESLTWNVFFENRFDPNSRVDLYITFSYSSYCMDIPVSIGEHTAFFMQRINDNDLLFQDNFLNMGEVNTASAFVSGNDDYGSPAIVETGWNWEVLLLSSNGGYVCVSETTTGSQSTWWTFTMPSYSELPNYDWFRNDDGYAMGYVRMYVDENGYHKEATGDFLLKIPPNKPKIRGGVNSNIVKVEYYTVGATKYDIRHKDVMASNWQTTINNVTYPVRQIALPTDVAEHAIQVRAHNEYGTGPWSDSYIVYSVHTPPFEFVSSTVGMPDNWNVSEGIRQGADRAFKFKLLNRATLTASTDYYETQFDSKIEIFNEDMSSTNIYNDDVDYGEYSSKATGTLNPGIYYLVVDGYGGEEGDFRVSLTIDETFYTLPFSLQSSNVGGNNSFNVNGSDGADVAFKIHLPTAATIDLTSCSSFTDYDTKLEIFNLDGTRTGFYNDDDLSGCDESDYASTIKNATLDAGSYYVVVDGYSGDVGNFSLDVSYSVALKSAAATNENRFIPMSDMDDLGKYDKKSQPNRVSDIVIYPNPASNEINVIADDNQELTYELFDASGRMVVQSTSIDSSGKIDISMLENGIYFIELRGKKLSKTEKIVIKH